MSKAFVGLWIDERLRKKLKITCVVHNITQSDVMELLLIKWLKEPHVEEDVKEIINGKE